MIGLTHIELAGGLSIPVYRLSTAIVGAGAAGMNCAVHLYEFMKAKGVEHPEDRLAVLTAGLSLGASRMSGSDKQTYYKMGTSPAVADSAIDFARTLTAFGCAHGDVALAEAESGLREFYHLVQAGVPFPHDEEGAFIGYKTDHDPYERATTAGPKTSKHMSECLQDQATRYGIPIFDKQHAAHLLKSGDRIIGVVTLDKNRLSDAFGLTVFLAENTVLAAGGPGELYEASVYPPGQTGVHGLALAAGLAAHNLTESQFGITSIKFRWNVSGTYMQVVPRIFSTDAEGNDPREFVGSHFPSTAKMTTNIFLKGYQWPFDPQRILDHQSSLIDMLVHQETTVKGRRVFLDFTRNPIPAPGMEPFRLEGMEEEALSYLQRNGALRATPIERLDHMNPLAIDIYSENGIDLRKEPLEIAVCAQHHNGGFVVDKWWESSVPRVFVVGEMAGTHGVKRPGGSALNAGQVGSLRAAEYIANVYGLEVAGEEQMGSEPLAQIEALLDKLGDWSCGEGMAPEEAIREIQHRMTQYAGHIRQLSTARCALGAARELHQRIRSEGFAVEDEDLIRAVQAEHLCVAHVAFLEGVVEYLEAGGGSRGSFIVLREDGDEISPDLLDPATGKPYRFVPENESLRATIAEARLADPRAPIFEFGRVPVRPIPHRDEPFEAAWTAYRTGVIYRKELLGEIQ